MCELRSFSHPAMLPVSDAITSMEMDVSPENNPSISRYGVQQSGFQIDPENREPADGKTASSSALAAPAISESWTACHELQFRHEVKD